MFFKGIRVFAAATLVSALAIIGCTTCHDAFANDLHVTGANYTKGSFKLRVPTGPNDEATLEKSPSAGTFTGTPAGKMGASNSCVYCHKSRKDVSNYITASNNLTSPHWGPHEAYAVPVTAGAIAVALALGAYRRLAAAEAEGGFEDGPVSASTSNDRKV